MTASTLIELDTTPPAITFADRVVNDALPFTLTEPAVSAAEILTADGPITLAILAGALQIPSGHDGATIRVHLRDDVANETTVEHLLRATALVHVAFADHARTAGAAADHAHVTATARDHARTAGAAADHAHVTATATDSVSP